MSMSFVLCVLMILLSYPFTDLKLEQLVDVDAAKLGSIISNLFKGCIIFIFVIFVLVLPKKPLVIR